MARNVYHLQCAFADADFLAVGEIARHRHVVDARRYAELLGLTLHPVAEEHVGLVGEHRRAEGLGREAVADGVVDMEMGVDDVGHRQVVALHEVDQSLLFFGIDHAGVDYGAFERGRVIDRVCVDAEEAECEFCYFHVRVCA